jgi:peptidoglycan/LPS O-acetylase OafA/YrhL
LRTSLCFAKALHWLREHWTVQYRKEIDGLRTIAVLPVMLFHAGLAEFSGGFVGVDVFFVISGYLITSMILQELTEGHFSLLSFYERRARRILPALFLVMFVTLVFAWILMVPSQLSDFGNSVIAVCLFFSNLYFRRASDYFAPSGEQLPLLHTWSLAVEEQYYVVIPLLILLLFMYFRKWLVPVLVLLTILSFGLAEWGLFSRPETRFFVAQTRAWELLLGSLIAIHITQRPRFRTIIEEALALIGVAMIAVGVFTLGSVEIHLELMTAEQRWIIAEKH